VGGGKWVYKWVGVLCNVMIEWWSVWAWLVGVCSDLRQVLCRTHVFYGTKSIYIYVFLIFNRLAFT